MQEIHLLDVVELAEEMPSVHIRKGQIATVVECLTDDMFLIELQSDEIIGLDGLHEVHASMLKVIEPYQAVGQAS
jgi:hypothetical protein